MSTTPRAGSRQMGGSGGGGGNAAMLQQKNAELLETVQGLERERDFYFSKLRDIELLIQQAMEADPSLEEDEGSLLKQIQTILYSTEVSIILHIEYKIIVLLTHSLRKDSRYPKMLRERPRRRRRPSNDIIYYTHCATFDSALAFHYVTGRKNVQRLLLALEVLASGRGLVTHKLKHWNDLKQQPRAVAQIYTQIHVSPGRQSPVARYRCLNLSLLREPSLLQVSRCLLCHSSRPPASEMSLPSRCRRLSASCPAKSGVPDESHRDLRL